MKETEPSNSNWKKKRLCSGLEVEKMPGRLQREDTRTAVTEHPPDVAELVAPVIPCT